MAINNPADRFEKLKKAAAHARKPYDKDALLNLGFFLDHQYIEWVPSWSTIREIPRKSDEVNVPRPVANKIMHFVQQEHALAMQADPNVDVEPATSDPQDVTLAEVSLAWLESQADEKNANFSGELSDAVMWALICGESFLKWTFNAKEDQLAVCSVSPLDLYADPYQTKFQDCRYVIHSNFMDIEQIYDVYGIEVQPQQLTAVDPEKAKLLRELGQSPMVNGAIVNELWMKPNRRFPEGVFVTWTGNTILLPEDKFPYDHGSIPFTQIGVIQRPGTYHFTCPVKYMRAPQMELNQYHAQRIMVRKKFSNPKWFVDTALELEKDPDDSPSQILRGNSSGGAIEPKLIQPTVFPENTDGDWIIREMQDIVGLHEIMQGQVPGRVEAAKAIELLKESDTSRLAELERTIKMGITNGFGQWLGLTYQYVKGTQIVTAYGSNGMPEVKYMQAQNPKIVRQRIRVTMGTGLARSRAAREDQVLNLWNQKVIQDPEVVSEALEIPIGVIAPQRDLDIRQARNENFTLMGGAAVVPNSWDQHDLHLREHNNFRKTADFLAAPDDVKKKFEFHCQTHFELQIRASQEQAQLMAAAQVPPAPPAAPIGEAEPTAPAHGQPQPEQPQQS